MVQVQRTDELGFTFWDLLLQTLSLVMQSKKILVNDRISQQATEKTTLPVLGINQHQSHDP